MKECPRQFIVKGDLLDHLDLLAKGSEKLKVHLNEFQLRKFDTYLKQLLFFNKKFNLTAITDPGEIVKKHFLDSLSVLGTRYFAADKSLLDIGAGAGFPGLALKIARPDLKLTLLEATRKKTLFLDYMIGCLKLRDASVVNMRAEDFGRSSGRAQFDLAITRALSALPTNLEYAIPTLKTGGHYLAMKAGLAKEPSTENACKELDCRLVETKKLDVPYLEAERSLVVFRKVAETDPKYPRQAGKPSKSPL